MSYGTDLKANSNHALTIDKWTLFTEVDGMLSMVGPIIYHFHNYQDCLSKKTKSSYDRWENWLARPETICGVCGETAPEMMLKLRDVLAL